MSSPLFQFGFSKLKMINQDPFRAWLNCLIVGSCNGLVCINLLSRYGFEDPIYICNPLTGEYIHLDRFNQECAPLDLMYAGFGYLPQTHEYKVVRIAKRQCLKGRVQVYTLGDGIRWRNKGEIDMLFQCDPGIFANGCLYWYENRMQKIVAFDLATEVFQVIQSPPCLNPALYSTASLHLLGDCLCLVHQRSDGPVELWLDKEKKDSGCGTNSDKHYFWTKECMFASESSELYTPLALTERGEILLWTDNNIMLCCL